MLLWLLLLWFDVDDDAPGCIDHERDVALWHERSLIVRWVFGSLLHGESIELFLVPSCAPRLE